MPPSPASFAPGVLTGSAVGELFALAKAEGFALPAVNCVGSNSINAVLETAGRIESPVIVQFSTSGSAFVGGKAVPVDGDQASILGSVAGARHERRALVKAVARTAGSDRCRPLVEERIVVAHGLHKGYERRLVQRLGLSCHA